MPEIGSSDGQKEVLASLDLNPADWENAPRDALTRSLQARMGISRGGNQEAGKETSRKKRIAQIERKQLYVGMPVDVLKGNGVKSKQNRVIREITDDGRVYLEGIQEGYFPQRIVPAGTW